MSSRIVGHVMDKNRRPVSKVKISLKGKTVAESEDDGFFSVTSASDESRVALTFAAEGYVTNTRVYNSKAQGKNVVVVWPIAHRLKFDPSRELDVEFESSRIRVPADALIGPNGKKISEMVELRFTWFDVTSQSQRAAAPGDFTGQLLDGSVQRLRSYGIFDFDLRNLKGQSLSLRQGASINLSIAVPPRLARQAPRQVGFFDFDTVVGQWTQVGSFDFAPGTLTYNGKMTQFGGSKNLDEAEQITCVTIQVIRWWDLLPMPSLSVVAHGPQSDSYGTTDANGFACLLVPRNTTFSVEAFGDLGSSAYGTPTQPSFTSPNFSSGDSDCGDPEKCPCLGTVMVDLIVNHSLPFAMTSE
jgi:hypothetical protein